MTTTYNKQCEKVILPQDWNLQPLNYRSAFKIKQWTGNPKTAGSNSVRDNFFALLVVRSRGSGGSLRYIDFRAGSFRIMAALG